MLPHKSYPIIPYPVLFQMNILIECIEFFYTEFTLTRDELFYSIPLGLDNGHPQRVCGMCRPTSMANIFISVGLDHL